MRVRYKAEALRAELKESDSIDGDTVFSGSIGGIVSIFLKMHAGVVDLKNPGNTWTGHAVDVYDYRKLDVELVVI